VSTKKFFVRKNEKNKDSQVGNGENGLGKKQTKGWGGLYYEITT